ncbi:exodeoxyribonuclease V subunit beta [Methylacidimicrobium sp. B4]|uniref:UvrD-helicase domain-containing protein n=1 Tax=Methylacidimicrobium sp. B4 TaxID=2796139 RepID=UPI001A8E4BA6|nr:UvrD-helicase domain-containing protein [Methylacidimicrobium sp. B4]QSR84752.1 UvrD-helicase domain-containing protein [Methylacidimicrobium sp. B4]
MTGNLPIARCCLIRASAGTGKTEALARRIVDLLRAGVDPHRIVAVTFTRRAAAEILDRVLLKLVEQAEADAAGRGAESGGPFRNALASLQAFLTDLPRLHLRTIDSLFQRIVRVCPMELGLPENFTLMDELEAGELRRSLLAQMLREDGKAAATLAEAIGLVAEGEEGKSVWAVLDLWISRFGDAYAERPERERWGGEALCLSLLAGCRETEGERLWEELGRKLEILDSRRAEEWEKLRPLLLAYRGSGTGDRVIQNILESYDPESGCGAEFYFQRKKIVPDPEMSRLLGRLARFWLQNGLEAACRRTRGLASFLAEFDARYQSALRRQGRIAFSDAPRLLRELGATGGGMDRDAWLRIAFRLDSQWDHWLLDEFQDTSRAQWQALQLLVEETIQATEGARTFFCVGDAKQSIYGWRGGDRKLFEEIASRYAGGVEIGRLAVSYRSRPAVIDLVNRVFGDPAVLEELYGKAGAAWAKEWEPHASVFEGDTGYSGYLEAGAGPEESLTSEEGAGESELEDEEAPASPVDRALARLMREIIRPAERGLSCAVLVQTNGWARRLANRLRKERIGSVFLEGEIFPGADNQLGRLVAAALQGLVHPGDTLARGWLDSSPLGERFRREWEETGWRLLHEKGFAGVVAEVLGRLPAISDEFAKERASLLREMACRFDQSGSRDVERFLRFWREEPVRLPETTGSVQVMTVHKAKGLGFDVVVVAELDRPVRRQSGLLEVEGAEGESGLLLAPGKAIVGKIPKLAEARAKAWEEELFERLCVLYVALTRARRELYVLAEAPRPARRAGSAAPTHRDLLRRALAGGEPRPLWEKSGIDLWFESGTRAAPERVECPLPEEECEGPGSLSFPPRALRSIPMAPSRFGDEGAGGALSPARAAAREWGRRVHEWLARIERADEVTRESLRDAAASAPEGAARDAIRAALACLESEPWEEIFAPPAGTVIWREKPFDALVSGRWISGIFDRVHLFSGPDGSPASAILYDFKTDRESGERSEERLIARYREQIGLYRAALAQMTSLPIDRVRAILVWIGPQRWIELSDLPARTA